MVSQCRRMQFPDTAIQDVMLKQPYPLYVDDLAPLK